MATGPERHLTDDRVATLARHMTQIVARLDSQPPPELLQLLSQHVAAGLESVPHHIPNPLAFYRMCRFISESGSPTMGELSSAISVPQSSATRWADWMVQNGFAGRLSDEHDRRVVRISLTETGYEFLEVIEGHMARNASRILNCLTDEEQAILLVIIEKVARALQEIEEQPLSRVILLP